MKPLEWFTKLLSRHGIQKPDCRPLYRYRVTDEEFENLKSTLYDACLFGIDNAVKTNCFDLAFVIYGAEWWRRFYAGNWGWDGIFTSLSADVSALSAIQRGHLIEVGLYRWGRRVRITNNSRSFLGSVAIEGGLPLHQMVSDSGWLGSILNQATKRLVELGFDQYEVSYIVSQYEYYLPQTFRKQEVYEILGDMVTAAVLLKQTHELETKDNPIEWLNGNIEYWRDEFPLPVDDEAAKAILSGMVQTAVSTVQNTEKAVIEGARYLSGVSTFNPHLHFHLTVQPFYLLTGLLPGVEDIPYRLQIELFNRSGKTWRFADAYRVQWKGRPALKINNTLLPLNDEDAVDTIQMRFIHYGESLHEIDIGAEGLDTEVPWIFVKKGERWDLAGQASQKLNTGQAIVRVPGGWSAQYEAEGNLHKIGECLGGELLMIDQNLVVSNAEDQYLIQVNQDEETPVQYLLSGKRLGYACTPPEVFIGKPSLRCLNKVSGYCKTINSKLVKTRPIGSTSAWNTLDNTNPGVHELRIVKDSVIMYRKRIVFLPEDFGLRFIASSSHTRGDKVNIDYLHDWQVACLNPDIKFQSKIKKWGMELSFSTTGSPPVCIDLQLWRENTRQQLCITVPYPSQGAIVITPDGTKSFDSADLFLDTLHGYRIRFFASGPTFSTSRISIRMELVDSNIPDHQDLYIKINRVLNTSSAEFSLMDFLGEMHELLAVSTNLDAYVKFCIFHEGSEFQLLRIRRFELNLEQDIANGEVVLPQHTMEILSIDELENMQLEAMRLSQPEQAPVVLEPSTSQGVHRGIWRFRPETRRPGPWLIYSRKNSAILARPLLWNIPGQIHPATIKSLHAAVYIDGSSERYDKLQMVFASMVEDHLHSGWDYLKCLWDNYRHLPLCTFEVWTTAAQNPRLLAAMAIYLEPETVVQIEKELPVMWEIVPIGVWGMVLNSYQSKLVSAIGDESIARTLICEKIDRIAEFNDEMGTIAKIIKQHVLADTDPDLENMNQSRSNLAISEGIRSEHIVLLQRQANAQWPILLEKEVEQLWLDLPEKLRDLLSGEQYYRATVVHLPFVLVHQLFLDDQYINDPLHVFKFRRLKRFDEDWYNAAFTLASGYWSQQVRKA